jgi:hypothetical protein
MPGYRDHLVEEHLHSTGGVYPTVGAGGAGWVAGATFTTNAAAGTFGVYADLIPINTIALPFDIHWINIESLGANSSYELVIAKGGAGSEIEVGRVRFTRINNQEAVNGCPFIMKIVPANTQIRAKVTQSNAGAVNIIISAFYHTY